MLLNASLRAFLLVVSGFFVAGKSLAQSNTTKIFRAEYTVPVSDDALKSYASFSVDNYIVETSADGTSTLAFLMPDDLSAGVEKNLKFFEVEKNALGRVLAGEAGVVRCTVPWLNAQCRIEFNRNAVPKYADVVDHVLGKYTLGEGWVQRLDVLRQFNTEPVGIVKVLELKK